MQTKTINQLAAGLSLIAGALDFCTGFVLVVAPALMLHLMGVKEVYGDLVYLRFVGAFVFCRRHELFVGLARLAIDRKGDAAPRHARNNHHLSVSGWHLCRLGYLTWLVGACLGKCHPYRFWFGLNPGVVASAGRFFIKRITV